eukprot:COSAG01_NODE_2642_length_7323_cov_13.197121_9_plen_228_part_01
MISLFISVACLANDTDSVKKAKKKPTPFLGIAMQAVDIDFKVQPEIKRGIKITTVLHQCAAKDAGLLPNDRIIRFDGKTFKGVTKNSELSEFKKHLTKQKKIGELLNLHVLRSKVILTDGKQLILPEQLIPMTQKWAANQHLPLLLQKKSQVITFSVALRQKPFERNSPPTSNAILFPLLPTSDRVSGIAHYHLKQQSRWAHYTHIKGLLHDTEYWDDDLRVPLLRYI